MNTASKGPAYDRQLLLDGAKRNTVLDLTEVQRYGMAGATPTTFVFMACGLPIGTAEEYGFWGEPRWNVPAMSWPTRSGETSPPSPAPFLPHPGR
jgi:hypothetical protein